MQKGLTAETRKVVRKWCLQSVLGMVGYGVVIFLAAGRLDWLWGWIFLGLMSLVLALQVVLLVPINPDLLIERSAGLRQEGGKTWDRIVTGLSGGVFPFISWILAGLDLRFGLSLPKPLYVHLMGTALVVFGLGLFMWAMVSNAYFSEVVRIQTERDHAVATGGPYRVVRHPGYTGAILGFVGMPLLLGSWWALIPAALAVGGYVLRTVLEDRTLQRELEGYRAYADRVRYRLVPGVW
jgi:protein-S-isoprenylcysteine O-methyltransferase Ste14